MMDTPNNDAADHELESWKSACRDLQHFSRDIDKLTDKIMAHFYGDDLASVEAIERDCRNHLTAANQRHAALRRVIDTHRANAHYSLKQVMVYEKKAAETIAEAHKAWSEMLGWVPKFPVAQA
jgi:hypothetical protein